MENELQGKIEKTLVDFSGVFSVVVRMDGEELVNINCDEVFYAASVIKIPIVVEAYRQVLEGKISLSKIIEITEEKKVGGYGILKEFTGTVKLPLQDLVKLVLIISDNTASNVVLNEVGMENVNRTMKNLGLQHTLIQRKLRDFGAKEKGIDNLITPRESALLLEMLLEHRILDLWACESILNILKRQQENDRLPLLLPDEIEVAHKPGGPFKGVSHDVGVVYTSPKPYIISCMSKDLPERVSKKMIGGDKGSQMIALISKMVYEDLARAS
jgi:beta-lactamase class A